MVKKAVEKNVGVVGIEVPAKRCEDKNCPFHGKISLRGRMFEGEVVSAKMDKSVVVSWNRLIKSTKYERYFTKRTKITAHLPPCMEASVGDKVTIMESRPISKTKNFVVIKRLRA